MVRVYSLSSKEVEWCLEQAKSIMKCDSHLVSKKVATEEGELKILFEGVCAEYAFSKITGGKHLTDVYLRNAESDNGDVVLSDGRVVDVKVTKYRNGRLLVPLWKKDSNVDVYALMIGECPVYRFVGMVAAEEVYCDDKICDLGYGPTYAVEQEALSE